MTTTYTANLGGLSGADAICQAHASAAFGMGLAISRRIVDAHGGRLCGEPNPGGPGSTFSFSLPVAPL